MTRRQIDARAVVLVVLLLALAAVAVLYTPYPWLALVFAPTALFALTLSWVDRRSK